MPGPGRTVTIAGRIDAWDKAAGATQYAGDVARPGLLHAAVVRSGVPAGRITGIDASPALEVEGVVGVYTAADVRDATFGRAVRDIPILAREVVRFTGEPVAAVVAYTREAAELGAGLVEVAYDETPVVFDVHAALAPGAPAVHDAPWSYPAAVAPEGSRNLQSHVQVGDRVAAEAALATSTHTVDLEFEIGSTHQGYLEPYSCTAEYADGKLHVWATNKSPFRLAGQLAQGLDLPRRDVVVHATAVGGDFGGKGAPQLVPLCAELARLTGRPVRIALRYSDDLQFMAPRHRAVMRVRLGADTEGRLRAALLDARFDGGAYAGYKPVPAATVGHTDYFGCYAIDVHHAEARVIYTHTVPRGHMRAPGAPQITFALESALDELAGVCDLSPEVLRERNLVPNGAPNAYGETWQEARGLPTLHAALAARRPRQDVPPGWLYAEGLAVYQRASAGFPPTSVRITRDEHGVRLELGVPETGTGSHTVAAKHLASRIGLDAASIDVTHVGTDRLDADPGASAGFVSMALISAVDEAANKLLADAGDPASLAEATITGTKPGLVSYCVEIARVAVDPRTGQVRVLEIICAVDVAEIVNPAAHRMQLEGGLVMGLGQAVIEDLAEDEGRIWAANLGDFKIPSGRDVPELTVVLVPGAIGSTAANIKPVGELANVPTVAAVANAVSRAVGRRVRYAPLRSESVLAMIREAADAR